MIRLRQAVIVRIGILIADRSSSWGKPFDFAGLAGRVFARKRPNGLPILGDDAQAAFLPLQYPVASIPNVAFRRCR